MKEFEIIQGNSLAIKLSLKKNGLPVDITDKTFKVILKYFCDNLDNDNNALINREIILTEEQILDSTFYVIFTKDDLTKDDKFLIGNFKFEVIAKTNTSKETLMQAKLIIKRSEFQDE